MDNKKQKQIEKLKKSNKKKNLLKILEHGLWDERLEVLKAFEEMDNSTLYIEVSKYINDSVKPVSLQAIKTLQSIGNITPEDQEQIDKILKKWDKEERRILNIREENENIKIEIIKTSENAVLIEEFKKIDSQSDKVKNVIKEEISKRGGIEKIESNIEKNRFKLKESRLENLLNDIIKIKVKRKQQCFALLSFGIFWLGYTLNQVSKSPELGVFWVITGIMGISSIIITLILHGYYSKEISKLEEETDSISNDLDYIQGDGTSH